MKLLSFIRAHKTFFLSIGFLVLFSITMSLATPPGAPYPAGSTLDPSCAPGSSNCTVSAPAATWGSIAGSITSQPDLVSALAAKEPLITAGSTAQYLRGDKSLATLDTSVVPENGNQYFTAGRVQTVGDARYPQLTSTYADPSWISALSFSKITNTPTTLSGYGITDAAPSTGSANYLQNTTSPQTASFNVTGNGTVGGTLAAAAVTGAITPTGFTQGSLAFAGTGGVLSQDNANLYWDGINHRLGIGTTTPTTALSVNGDATVSGNLSVNGTAVDPLLANNATIAYVETTGNDSTGALGKANRPFATINAALDALPSSGGVIKLGVGVFAPITDDHSSDPFVANPNSKLKDNVTLIGAKQPGFKSDLTGLEDGTIIQGPLTIDRNNIKLYNLGIDSGSAVVNSLYAGVAQNALAIENIGQVASPGTKAPRRGIVAHNITAIAKDPTSAVHAALFENLDTPDIENIKTTYGTHGVVLKISGGSARGLYAQGNASDGVIIKANAYAPGTDTVVSDVVIRSINTYDTGGLRLMNNDNTGGTPPDLSGLAISNVVTDGTTFDVEFDSFNSTQIKNVRISNLVSKNVQSSMVINGAVDKASVVVNGVSLTGVTASTNATGSSQNIAAGYGAFALNTSGYQNAVLGVSALASNTSGYTNVAIGYQSLTANVGGYANTAVGAGSLVANVGGFGNTAMGVNALMTNNTGIGNTAIGLSTLNSNSSGQYNTAVGTGALFSNTTANNNSAFGRNTLFANTTGSGNAGFAFNALHDNITGNNNAAFGEGALQSQLASNNTAIGYHAGILATAGNNIFLGYQAGDAVTTGTNNIVLGYDVDAQSPTASNQLNIANLIYSTAIDGTGTTISTGNIGIGIKATTARLEVQGTTSDNTTNAFIALNAAGSTPLLIVRDDGNIGINVASPNDKLDVVGVSRFGASTEKISMTSGSLGFNRNTSTGAIFDTNGFAYQFQHTKSTTNTSDTLAVQVYNTAGTNITTSAFVINGAGSVGMGTLTPSSKFDVTVNSIGATQAGVTAGISVNNTTAAALGAQQISPQIRWSGQGWGTTAGTSQTVNFREYLVPVQGTVPTGYLAWESSVAAGAFSSNMVLTSIGNLGIGTTTPGGVLTLAGSRSAAAWGTAGINFQTGAATYTDTSSVTGTVASNMVNSFDVPTLAASNTGVIYTTAATLYIAGAPAAGTNVTLSNAYAFNVASGNSLFSGFVYGTGGLATAVSQSTANFYATGGTAISATGNGQAQFAGGATASYRVLLNAATTSSPAISSPYGNLLIGSSPVTTPATGTNALLANLVINPIGTVTAGGASITNTATVYVNGAASTAGITGANYSLWVNGGLTLIGASTVTTGTTVARFQNAGGTCDVIPSTSGGISCSSDMNLKKNITTLADNSAWSYNANITTSNQGVLAKILALNPVDYNWNVEQDSDPKHAGFIAQEVRQVFPDLVTEDATTHLLSLNYAGLIPYTVQAIKEMNVTLQSLPTFTDPTLATKVANFLRGIAVDNTARVDTVQANKICIQDVCLTKEDFQQLLQSKQQGSNAPMTTTVTTPPPSDTSTPAVDTPAVEIQTPEVSAPEPEAPTVETPTDTATPSVQE